MSKYIFRTGRHCVFMLHVHLVFISKLVNSLKGAMMLSMMLYQDGEVAVLHVDQNMMQRYGAVPSDCEAALEEVLHLPSVKVALLLRENKNLTLQGSLRSDGSVNVNSVAKHFGMQR